MRGMLVYQIQDRYLHHTLIEICRPVLHNFDCYYFLCFQVLAFDYLTEGALPKNIKYQISIPARN